MNQKIECLCEHEFEMEVPEKVDLDKDNQIKSEILEGNFLTVNCPKCQKLLTPEFLIHFTSEKLDLDIYLVPELERDAFLSGIYKTQESKRVAIGYQELQEKILISENNLNDECVELIKHILIQKAEDPQDLKILLDKVENETLIFAIRGLKEGEIGLSRIPKSLYQKVETDLEKSKEDETVQFILSPPYVSIRKVEYEKAEEENEA